MFNFHGPPHNLVPNRSRVSVSDTGINVNRVQPTSQEIHHPRRGGTNSNAHNRVQGQGFGHDPVSLPPIAKTRSLTGARRQSSTFSLNRPQRYQGHPTYPPEPKKLPTQREMLFLTLTHAKPPSSSSSSTSSRGLTFDQLSSFLRGAFEIPKNIAWESKLRKTLSNMVSKGVVINHPGLGPHDSTFQIAETRDTGLDLSVSGKSVPKIPTWPTGLTLPNGANLICRTAHPKTTEPIMGGFQPYDSKKQQGQRQQQMDSRTTTNNFRQGRNPQSVKLDPMPYMPIADPMICQSFGVRAGLVNSNKSGFEARRPNSPNTSETEGFPSEWTETEATEGGGRSMTSSPYDHDVSSGVGLGAHWKPVMPTDTPPSESEASFYHIQNGREINPYMRQHQVKKPAPRILDTVSHHLKSSPAATFLPEEDDDDMDSACASANYNNNESEYDSGDNGNGINNPREEDEEEENEDIYINHMENEDFTTSTFGVGQTGGVGTEKSKILKLTTGSGFVHSSSGSLRSSQPAPAKGPSLTTGVKTLALAMGKPAAQALKANSTSRHLKKTEALPLENFDIFADYAGETRAEYEINSRSCSIMNDIPIKRIPPTKAGDSAFSSMGDLDMGGAGDSFPDNNSEVASSVKTISQSCQRTSDNQSIAEPFDTKMDYLMGIADIIGGYDEKPLELRKSGTGTGSRSKPKPSVVSSASTNKKFNTGVTFRKN